MSWNTGRHKKTKCTLISFKCVDAISYAVQCHDISHFCQVVFDIYRVQDQFVALVKWSDYMIVNY